jgi:hypothetical protein
LILSQDESVPLTRDKRAEDSRLIRASSLGPDKLWKNVRPLPHFHSLVVFLFVEIRSTQEKIRQKKTRQHKTGEDQIGYDTISKI